MALIGIEDYKIRFSVLENDNPKEIILLDQSKYLDNPEKPILQVILPGFIKPVEIEYLPNSIIVLNSDSVKLTDECDYDYLADLPDGVYQIRMAVCPYDELNYKLCYLKSTILTGRLQNLLLTYDNCNCFDIKDFQQSFLNISILIDSAKAEALSCNIDKASKKYQTALNELNYIERKINCN